MPHVEAPFHPSTINELVVCVGDLMMNDRSVCLTFKKITRHNVYHCDVFYTTLHGYTMIAGYTHNAKPSIAVSIFTLCKAPMKPSKITTRIAPDRNVPDCQGLPM